MPRTMTINEARQKIARLSNQRDYWRRIALSPDSESARKAVWREKNPTGYRRELRRNKIGGRARRATLRGLIFFEIVRRITNAKRASQKGHLGSVSQN